MRVYTCRLWTVVLPYRLEVDNLRGRCWTYEGRKPRHFYFGGTEFLEISILFALGKLHLLEDLAGYASELLSH